MSEVKVNKISPRTNCGTVTVGDSGDSVSVTAGVPVTVNGDLKSNALKATDGGVIISQSGTNITIGASGDTVSLASGASQSGFGREGSVDWQTGSIKTSTFTAVSGEGYFVDTSSGTVTANLPAGSAGAIVAFADYTRTFGNNALTIVPNGTNKIGGVVDNASLDLSGQAATFVFVDATEGWINVQNAETTETGASFIAATGGTITTSGNFKIHTFTGPGTFCVSAISSAPASNEVDYMVVAGGGAGGGKNNGGGVGGGGAGGIRIGSSTQPSPMSPSALIAPGHTVSVSAFPITVGGGGACSTNVPDGTAGTSGSNSSFSSFTAAGGGGGNDAADNGSNGGSGGGAGEAGGSAGAGNQPPVSPPQGNPGGTGNSPSIGGGGGGFTTAGENSTPSPTSPTGNGGAGIDAGPIFGTANGSPGGNFGGGGGASTGNPSGGPFSGGSGGGGQGNAHDQASASGATNTGGGGGGHGSTGAPQGGTNGGGSGIVIIRYKFQ